MEEWRDVPGYDGIYQISISTKEGKCRRIYKNGKIKELSNTPNKCFNRIYWSLCKDGVSKKPQAAVWIALTYPELVQNEWFPGAEIDHIDTDRLNNHPFNLRWVTRSDNLLNPITVKHNSDSHKGKSHKRKGKTVLQFTINYEFITEYCSAHEASKETGISRGSISNCCRGETVKCKNGKSWIPKTAGGYIWKYAE